jgi:hypothetical protein
MRYIKKFEDIEYNDYSDYIKELQDFFDNHLAYLIDDGFDIYVQTDILPRIKFPFKGSIRVDIGNVIFNEFKWSEVKDNLIPFLEFLSKKYYLSEEPIGLHKVLLDTYTKTYTLYDVVNNTGDFIKDGYHDDSRDISYISIYVKQPKN